MGNVNQEAILFNDTFNNNITFGVKDVTPSRLAEAAKIANAHEFIMESENGLRHQHRRPRMPPRGHSVSVCQSPGPSLKNPPILILDEATSALTARAKNLCRRL